MFWDLPGLCVRLIGSKICVCSRATWQWTLWIPSSSISYRAHGKGIVWGTKNHGVGNEAKFLTPNHWVRGTVLEILNPMRKLFLSRDFLSWGHLLRYHSWMETPPPSPHSTPLKQEISISKTLSAGWSLDTKQYATIYIYILQLGANSNNLYARLRINFFWIIQIQFLNCIFSPFQDALFAL